MKSGHVLLIMAGVSVAGCIAYAFLRHDTRLANQPVAAEPQAVTRKVVQVDELAANPEHFTGEIVLRAVVAAVNEQERVLSVIDSAEFESCGVLTCAKNYLPVTFAGKLPPPKTIVEITGQVAKTTKGLVFEAKHVDTVQ